MSLSVKPPAISVIKNVRNAKALAIYSWARKIKRPVLRPARLPANFILGGPMNVTTITRQLGDVTIVDISGRIVLGEECAVLRNLVAGLLANQHIKILFNL